MFLMVLHIRTMDMDRYEAERKDRLILNALNPDHFKLSGQVLHGSNCSTYIHLEIQGLNLGQDRWIIGMDFA